MWAEHARTHARIQLRAAGFREAERESRLIAAYLAGVEPSQLILYLEASVDEERLGTLLARRLAGEPLQYLLGEAGFMGLTFAVGPGVLIPRPDTEIIVEKAISLLQGKQAPFVADICTGSGAIAVSLAHHLPQAVVHATDISPEALRWAEINTQTHGVAERCRFYEGDMLAPLLNQEHGFDMILCNPPYITQAEMAELSVEVRHEPELALYGGADGLIFYRRLAQEAKPLVKPGGWLLLEHGAEQQEQLTALLTQAGWQVTERLADYGGRARGIAAQMPQGGSHAAFCY